MARRAVTSLDLSGPFFRHNPKLTFRANVKVMLKAIADEAAEDIATQYRAGQGRRSAIHVGGGRVSEQVEGYMRGVRSGREWKLTSRVHIKNSGLTKARAVSLHAAASVLENRVHAFRKTSGRMRRSRAVNRAELLKGLH